MRRTAPSLACYKTSPPPKKRVSKISSETKGWLDRDRQPLKKKLHIIPKSLLQPGSSLTLVLNFVRPPLLPGAIPVQVLLVGKAGLIQGAFRGDANAFRVLLDTIHPPFLGSATGSPAILGKPHCVSCVWRKGEKERKTKKKAPPPCSHLKCIFVWWNDQAGNHFMPFESRNDNQATWIQTTHFTLLRNRPFSRLAY